MVTDSLVTVPRPRQVVEHKIAETFDIELFLNANFYTQNTGILLCPNTYEHWYSYLRHMKATIERGQLNTDYCNKHHNLKTINEQRYNMLVELCK